jgi:hypothetical protein
VKVNWVRGITGFDPVANQPATLVCWLGGEEARRMEELPDEVIKRELGTMLKQFVGSHVPDPVSIVR